MKNKMSIFETLNSIDVSKYVKNKGRFSYLPWSDAWSIVKTHYPNARYENKLFKIKVPEHELTIPYAIDHNGYAYVQTTVYINDEVQTEDYPVLNHTNKPIQNPNSFEINTALKRALAKACANFGLGLYIYRGEDLPEIGQTRLDGSVPEQGEITVDQNVKLDRLSRHKSLSDEETKKIKDWMNKKPSEIEADKQIEKITELINKRKKLK